MHITNTSSPSRTAPPTIPTITAPVKIPVRTPVLSEVEVVLSVVLLVSVVTTGLVVTAGVAVAAGLAMIGVVTWSRTPSKLPIWVPHRQTELFQQIHEYIHRKTYKYILPNTM